MKDQILNAAMQIANLQGFGNVTRNAIADRLECSTGSVSYHYSPFPRALEKAMVERAIETKNLKMLGQALAKKNGTAMKAPEELKRKALLSLA